MDLPTPAQKPQNQKPCSKRDPQFHFITALKLPNFTQEEEEMEEERNRKRTGKTKSPGHTSTSLRGSPGVSEETLTQPLALSVSKCPCFCARVSALKDKRLQEPFSPNFSGQTMKSQTM